MDVKYGTLYIKKETKLNQASTKTHNNNLSKSKTHHTL